MSIDFTTSEYEFLKKKKQQQMYFNQTHPILEMDQSKDWR